MEQLIQQGESNTVEFKTSTAKLNAAFKTICAFLNGKGGTVLIGVNDHGKVVGQDVTDNTRREIAREKKKIEPTAPIDVHYVNIKENKFVVAIQVDAGEHSPYVYDGRPFQRDESETNRMSQHHYEQLLVKRGQLNHSWEDVIATEYTLDDLDHEEIYRTVMDGVAVKRIPPSITKEEVEKILRQLELIVDGKPKRAAVALYGKEIKSGYKQCWLKMARFKGTDKAGDFIDNQQIHCNAFRMLEEADNFFRKHLPMASYFKPDQFKRIDKLALPVLAIREALVNAMCHRNYSDRSGYVSIAIFDDAVEIWSDGVLPKKLKLEDLKRKHDSVLRNELIAKIFYLRGYIESWGTGIEKMTDSCKEHGIPAPKFSERTGGLVVTFKFAELIGGYKEKKEIELTPRQLEILKLLEKSSLNGTQLAEKLSDTPSVRIIQKDLVILERAGLVSRKGKARAIVWDFVKRE